MPNYENFDQKSDEEIVSMVLSDQDFFLHIVDRYKHKLFNYIRRISSAAPEDIEDLLQNIFLKVYLNLNDFNHNLKFSSWIYRIAHNETIDFFRKSKARPKTSELDLSDNSLSALASDINIEKEIDAIMLKSSIAKALDLLDRKYKEVLVLKFFEEKNYREISDIIKKPPGTVASRINKAKAELRNILQKT
jgi:RNA polymerase sigma-70 factor, ECF subfamily